MVNSHDEDEDDVELLLVLLVLSIMNTVYEFVGVVCLELVAFLAARRLLCMTSCWCLQLFPAGKTVGPALITMKLEPFAKVNFHLFCWQDS